MRQDYDVLIIASGAGGGTLARQLAPSGKSILILERGDWLKREAANWVLHRGLALVTFPAASAIHQPDRIRLQRYSLRAHVRAASVHPLYPRSHTHDIRFSVFSEP